MVIAAHPDDADFGPAATAARWIDEGSVGWLVCCTSGDAGGEDPDIDPLELAAIREREQRAAAEVVGYEGVTFLHMPDGALVNDLILREHLVREIRTFRPDAVLATDPENAFPRDARREPHGPPRRRLGRRDAVYPAARNPMAFPCARPRAGSRSTASAGCTSSGRTAERVRRHHGDGRPEARRPALPRRARSRTSPRSSSGSREWSASQGKEIGVANADGFYLVVIDDDEESAAAEPRPPRPPRAGLDAAARSVGARPGASRRGGPVGRPPRRSTGRASSGRVLAEQRLHVLGGVVRAGGREQLLGRGPRADEQRGDLAPGSARRGRGADRRRCRRGPCERSR